MGRRILTVDYDLFERQVKVLDALLDRQQLRPTHILWGLSNLLNEMDWAFADGTEAVCTKNWYGVFEPPIVSNKPDQESLKL